VPAAFRADLVREEMLADGITPEVSFAENTERLAGIASNRTRSDRIPLYEIQLGREPQERIAGDDVLGRCAAYRRQHDHGGQPDTTSEHSALLR
jgi:hypothetical protein